MNRINPKKLLHSKWTAVTPVNREKHFMITEMEFEEDVVVRCVLEAVMTKHARDIDWHDLTDDNLWKMGWK